MGKFVYLMSQEDDKITEPVVTLINNMLETRENCYMDNKLDIYGEPNIKCVEKSQIQVK